MATFDDPNFLEIATNVLKVPADNSLVNHPSHKLMATPDDLLRQRRTGSIHNGTGQIAWTCWELSTGNFVGISLGGVDDPVVIFDLHITNPTTGPNYTAVGKIA